MVHFWIADSPGNWSDKDNWSAGSVPTSNDIVQFTSSHNGDCTVTNDVSCKSIDFQDDYSVDDTGYGGTFKIDKDNTLYIYLNLFRCSSDMILAVETGEEANVEFNYAGGDSFIYCAYMLFPFNIRVTGGNKLRFLNTQFNFDGKKILVSGAGSGINCNDGTGKTFSVFSETVDFYCIGLDSNTDDTIFSAKIFYWGTSSGNASFSFIYQKVDEYDVETLNNFYFRIDEFLIEADNNYQPAYFGALPNGEYINVVSKGNYNFDNCNLVGVHGYDTVDGSWDLSGMTAGDVGFNDNITFISPITCYFYATGATCYLDDKNVYRIVPGPGPLSRFPLAHDKVVINNSSYSSSVQLSSVSVAKNGLRVLPSINTSTLTKSGFYFRVQNGSRLCSNLILHKAVLFYSPVSYYFIENSSKAAITFSASVNISGGRNLYFLKGTFNLASNIAGQFSWVFRNCKFNSNNYNINVVVIKADEEDSTFNLDFGSSILTWRPGGVDAGGFVHNGSTKKIDLSNATLRIIPSLPVLSTTKFLGVSVKIVDITSVNYVRIWGDDSYFETFKINEKSKVLLNTVVGGSFTFKDLKLLGEAGADVYFEGASSSNKATFTVTNSVEADYVHLKNTDISPADTFNPGEHSNDDGNNVGWLWGGGHNDYYETLGDSIALFDADYKFSSKVLVDVPKLVDFVDKSSMRYFSDSFSLSDKFNKKEFVDVIDVYSLDDSVEKKRTVFVSVDDGVGLGDLLGKSFGGSRVLSDGFDLFDSDFRNITRSFFDDVGLVDDVSLFSKKFFSDAVVLDAELVKKPVKVLVDGYLLDDELGNFVVGKTLVDDVVLFDSGSKDYSKLFFDSVKLSESLGVGRTLILFDRLFLDDVLVKSVGFNVLDELVLDDVVNKGSSVSVGSSVVLDDLVVKKPLKVVSSGVGLDDLLEKSVSKSVVDNFALFDSDFKHTSRVLSNVLGVDDSVFRFVGKSVLDEFLLKDDLVKKGLKNVFSNLSLDDFVSKYVKRSFVDELELGAWVNKKVSIKPLVDSFSLKDFVVEPILKPEITQMQKDFVTILHDVPMAEYIDWYRVGKFEDEMGRLKRSKKLFNKTIYIILQPLTEKDRNFLERGVNVDSYMKAYAEPRYYFKNKRIEIEVGDVFVRSDGQRYMVEQVAGKWGNFKAQVFRKLILRGIDND